MTEPTTVESFSQLHSSGPRRRRRATTALLPPSASSASTSPATPPPPPSPHAALHLHRARPQVRVPLLPPPLPHLPGPRGPPERAQAGAAARQAGPPPLRHRRAPLRPLLPPLRRVVRRGRRPQQLAPPLRARLGRLHHRPVGRPSRSRGDAGAGAAAAAAFVCRSLDGDSVFLSVPDRSISCL
ncbi:putative zinc finger protein 8 [Iris pallida]|uniref:Zinc finger protein 8 n=1 Tax=Iris pallida TaxID=29817 RepID=A0AAX6HLH0_IRIPA|nr:putative zinc finger protein 8 [Iris pallida]